MLLTLVVEVVENVVNTWCRARIEDDDIRVREVWRSVTRLWYSTAPDKAPTTGRLYHHLSILARLYQLIFYVKDLTVDFPSQREHIMSLLHQTWQNYLKSLRIVEVALVKCHSTPFRHTCGEKFEVTGGEFLRSLGVDPVSNKTLEQKAPPILRMEPQNTYAGL